MVVFALLQLKYVVFVVVATSVIFSIVLLSQKWEERPYHPRKFNYTNPETFLSSFKWTTRDIPDSITQLSCRNTKQGINSVTDDRGYFCKRHDIDSQTSCCSSSLPTIFFADQRLLKESELDRFSCKGCEENSRCCKDYEICVSCCLDPDKKSYLENLLVSNLPLYSHVTDQFELCSNVCRTSSRTLYHEREYKSDVLKYCFNNSGPPSKK